MMDGLVGHATLEAKPSVYVIPYNIHADWVQNAECTVVLGSAHDIHDQAAKQGGSEGFSQAREW